MPHFAAAFARLGHPVILLTKSLGDKEQPRQIDVVAREIATHDWTRPYHLPCVPHQMPLLRLQREGQVPRPLSKAIVAFQYLFYSGVFTDWVRGASVYWQCLASAFKPDLIWATFGCTDSWIVAKNLAAISNVPWVMDVKDGWNPATPTGLRHLLAWRFRDAAWMTSNSELMADSAKKWFKQRRTTIYSGVAPELTNGRFARRENDEFRIVLVGSLYHEPLLQDFLCGVEAWLQRLSESERSHVRLTYAGSNTKMVERNVGRLRSACAVDCTGYLSFCQFVELIQSASVNAYLWRAATFHHKLIELLACDRPIIAFPGEHEESKALARQVSGKLNCCPTTYALVDCLEAMWRGELSQKPETNRPALQSFTWDAQAHILLRTFRDVLTL